MRKVLSRKNLDTSHHGDFSDISQHGGSNSAASSIRRSVSNVKLSKSFSKSFGDNAW